MLIIHWGPFRTVDDDAPPMGLSEDVAYDPPLWAKAVLALSVLALAGTVLLMVSLGIALVTGNENAVKVWDFWGNTDLLGGLLIAAAILVSLGIGVLMMRNDDSLVLLLLGVVVFEVTLLRGVARFEGAGGPTLFLMLMLIPFLALFGLQVTEVRRWLFQSSDPLG